MFDIGWSELLLVGVLCLFVFGPEDIPNIMYNFGRIVRRFRYLRYAMSSQFDDFMEKAEKSAKKTSAATPEPVVLPPAPGTQESEEADTDDYLMELRPPPESVESRPVILADELEDHGPNTPPAPRAADRS